MEQASGLLEISEKGYGFLRSEDGAFKPSGKDIYVPPDLIRKKQLREGLFLEGQIRNSGKNRGPQLVKLDKINGREMETYADIIPFDALTSINPHQKLKFETTSKLYTTRVIDLLCPVGKGQRGLIVAPPRTGKTILLQQMAEAVIENHPEMTVIVLLVDERPEEVTDMRRKIKGEVYASTNDSNFKSHVRIAQMVSEKSKRLVEMGEDVIVFMDSITRLGRAYNNFVGSSGRTLSGGLDAQALEKPKKIFGAARKTEEQGSLTILATALIDTGSRMDDFIFQEFKGTGNMEMVLERKLADRRIWPAMNINLSGTRREELLHEPVDLDNIHLLRKQLANLEPAEAMQMLHKLFDRFPSNRDLLDNINK